MISVFGLLRFNDTYKDTDARRALNERDAGNTPTPLPGSLLNIVTERGQRGIDYSRGSLEVDAISQFRMHDVSAGFVAAERGEMDVGGGLSQEGLKDIFVFTTFSNTVIQPPPGGKFVKRMSLLSKRPDVDVDRFKDEWFNLHALLVKRMSGIVGYRQNIVIDAPPQGDRDPVTGIVELWFDEVGSIDKAFRSDSGLTTMTHAREFIQDITTFMVEPVPL